MKSNGIYEKHNILSSGNDNALQSQKYKTERDSSKKSENKPIANDTVVNTRNTTVIKNDDDKEQFSVSPGNSNKNKYNVLKYIQDKKVKNSQNSLNYRYKLNAQNYIIELHKMLIKECKDNLIEINTVNATLDREVLYNISTRTNKAIKDQKIFSVLGYFPKISEELKNRGWVEKRDPCRPPINYLQYLKSSPYVVNWIESPPMTTLINSEKVVIDRMKNLHTWSILKDKRSDLIFVTRKRLINWVNLHELTSVSQMTKHAFCSKNGLAQCLEPYKNTLTNLMFPRCHYIRNQADYDAFLEDYIITALIGTLKIIIQSIEDNKIIFSKNGNIPYEMITFVQRCIFKYLNKLQTGFTETDFWKFETHKNVWDEFMQHYTKLIIDDYATFFHEYSYNLELEVYAKCRYLFDNIKMYCPQHYIDGYTNTWIIKPISNCSGHGIIMTRDLNKIREKNYVEDGMKNNYILQKYIEKPLLIYTCKIDLRQWFLVTNMNPVVVWMYKEGYVRFCANSFSMQNMHESIHLSNVRLQMKYRKIRRPNVPEECMWDYKELQNHLENIGQENVWDELIFPGMSESIYTVIQASKAESLYRAKSFQLFGADFVITDNFVPFLIEINSIPGLNPSTSVIANLAPMLLGDIIKVVVDYAENPKANTGLFTKIVPEKQTPTTVARRTGQETPLFIAPKVPRSTADVSHHRQWVESINNKLTAMRFTINDRRESPIDRYLGCNRGNMLALANVNDEKATTAAAAGTKKMDDDTEKHVQNDSQSTRNTDRSRSSDRPSDQNKRRRMID